MRKLFTSESVTEGHPDKLCDQVSDAVLDALLAQDPMSRVACETCATTGMVMVMGEITTTAKVDIPAIVRDVVLDIGYNDSSLCFDGNTCAVLTSIHAQSPDIAMGVDDALETRTQDANEIGAGDQGMMFGFACDETPEYMPTAIAFAHRLTRRLTEVRKNGTLPWLRPDGKAQVTIAYEDGQPVAVDTIVISTQHNPEMRPRGHLRGDDGARHPPGDSGGNADGGHPLSHQPDRALCHRRACGRLRSDRAQDYR